MAVIEVETVESVNNLEALAEWVPYGRLKSAFHLYVPAQMIDVARRLCTDSNIPVDEIHTYHWIGDEMRFMPVYKAPADGRVGRAKAAAQPTSAKPPARPAPPKAPAKSASPKAHKKSSKPAAKKSAGKSGKKVGRSTKR